MLVTRFSSNSNVIKSNSPLLDEQIKARVPSIFAQEKHESRSDRYTYIPTSELLTELRKEGFQPFFACQAKSRVEGNHEFTKHMIRLRHESQIVQAEANEIIIINSHNGSSAYQMLAGCLRFACQNGLIRGDINNDIRIKHSGNIIDNVIEGAYTILDNFKSVDESKALLKSIALNPDEQRIFAETALMLRYDEKAPAGLAPEQLLKTNRRDDLSPDLWTTFNKIQENTIRGKIRFYDRESRKFGTTRAVNGIDQSVKLNKALWTLAEKMAELKAA